MLLMNNSLKIKPNAQSPPLPSTPTNRIRHRKRTKSLEVLLDVSKITGGQLLLNDQNKYKSMWIRTYSSLWMTGFIILIVYLGHLYICTTVIVVQILMAVELFHLRRRIHEDKRLPGFWLINWYFFFTAMLYVYGRILSQHLVNTASSDKFFHKFVNGLTKYHVFICYFLIVSLFSHCFSKTSGNVVDLFKLFGSKSSVIRKRKEWDVYEHVVDLLSNEEVDAIEAKEERASRSS